MPRLINTYQHLLPTVYIKKMRVMDYSVEVDVCIYLKAIDGSEPVEVTDYISENITFYAMGLFNETHIESVISGKNQIYEYSDTYFRIYQPSEDLSEIKTIHEVGGYNFATYIFDFSSASDSYYNNNNELIYEYSTTFTYYPYEAETLSWLSIFENAAAVIEDTEDIFAQDPYQNFTIFAFASNLSINPLFYADLTIDSDLSDAEKFLAPKILKEQNIGFVAYETIFIDGKINDQPITSYVYSGTNIMFQGEPLRSLGGNIYDTELTYNTVFSELTQLISDSGVDRLATRRLLDILSSTESSTFDQRLNIMPALNKYRKSFPDKITGSPVGDFYQRFSKLLLSFNRTIENGEKVHKKLFTNSKIIETRYLALDEYDPDALVSNKYSYDDSQILYDYPLISRRFYTNSSNTPMIKDEGVFFLDYEKIMQLETNLSKVYNVDIVEKIFNTSFTNCMLRLKSTKFDRHVSYGALTDYFTVEYSDDDREIRSTMQVSYANEIGDHPGITYEGWPSPIQIYGEGVDVGDFYLEVDSGYPLTESSDNSHCNIKSFNTLTTDRLYSGFFDHEYRLMAFEFENYYAWSRAAEYNGEDATETSIDKTVYCAEVSLVDDTLQNVFYLTSSYLDTYDGPFTEYFEMAAEFCNYNNANGTFNDFFVEKANIIWPATGPWESAPLIYNIHLDLLLNTFNGNREAIIDASRQISQNISPSNGTLEQLASFATKYFSLYSDYYAAGGTVANLIDTLEDQELTYSVCFEELPDIYEQPVYGETTTYIYSYIETAYTIVAFYGNLAAAAAGTTLKENSLTYDELITAAEAALDDSYSPLVFAYWFESLGREASDTPDLASRYYKKMFDFNGSYSSDPIYETDYWANEDYSKEEKFGYWLKLYIMEPDSNSADLDDFLTWCEGNTVEALEIDGVNLAQECLKGFTSLANYLWPNAIDNTSYGDDNRVDWAEVLSDKLVELNIEL